MESAHLVEQLRRMFAQWHLSCAAVVMGITPAGDTRASTGTSFGVTGITPSSIICTEYDNATAKQKALHIRPEKT